MSKISYHKNGHKHDAVAKAKRMLNKIEKQFGGLSSFQFYCDIQLTGINDIDRRDVKNYLEKHLKKLQKDIDKQLFRNEKMVNGDWNDEYEEGYWMPTLKEQMQVVEAINEVYNFIWNEYPDIEVKQSETLIFKETTPQAKYKEAVAYFKAKPIFGFNTEYFARLENGKSRKLYPITFSAHDLDNAIGVYAKYQ
jgi:hypothetical protein